MIALSVPVLSILLIVRRTGDLGHLCGTIMQMDCSPDNANLNRAHSFPWHQLLAIQVTNLGLVLNMTVLRLCDMAS